MRTSIDQGAEMVSEGGPPLGSSPPNSSAVRVTPQKAAVAAESQDPLTMPMPAPQAAARISAVGVEGVPSDPTSGPRMIRWEIAGAIGIVLLAAVVLGLAVSVPVGMVVLVVGTVALLFNPVIGAARGRARERQEVIDQQVEQR